MAKDVKETAEKKLLKLIESQEKSGGSTAAAGGGGSNVAESVARSVQGPGVGAIALPSFLNPLLDLLKGLTGGKGSGAQFGLKQVNNILLAAVSMFLLILVFTIWRGMHWTQQTMLFDVDTNIVPNSRPLLPIAQPLSAYINQVRDRNIFFPFEKKAAVQANVPAPEQALEITDKIKDFRLVGISWLDTADSATAMIEDQKTSITHFLRQGDEFKGVKIKTIYADRVIFSFKDETSEIKL